MNFWDSIVSVGQSGLSTAKTAFNNSLGSITGAAVQKVNATISGSAATATSTATNAIIPPKPIPTPIVAAPPKPVVQAAPPMAILAVAGIVLFLLMRHK